MKNMIKHIKLLLVFLLITSLTIGCSVKSLSTSSTGDSTGLQSSEEKNTVKDENSILNELGKLPLLKEHTKFSIFLPKASTVLDHETNLYTKYIEENANIEIEFQLVAEDAAEQKFSLMVSAGESLPDIVCMTLKMPELLRYGQLGIFVPLNDYYENSSYWIKNYLDTRDLDFYLPSITSPDGNIYTVPYFLQNDGNTYHHKAYINNDWLNKLGLSIPKTTEELYKVLKEFSDKDPNGNNQKDEIPMIGATNGYGTQIWLYLMNAFVYCSPDVYYLTNEFGEIRFAYDTDQWLEGLQFMNRLCKEGLLNPLTFTQDAAQYKVLLGSGDRPSYGVIGCNSFSVFPSGTEDRQEQYESLAPLIGPNGVQWAIESASSLPRPKWQITKDCKYPEAAFRIADFMCSFESTNMAQLGVEGINYELVEGEPLYKNAKIIYKMLTVTGDPQNSNWGVGYAPMFRLQGENSQTKESATITRLKLSAATPKYAQHAPKESFVGKLILTLEETEEVSDIITTLDSYVNEMLVAFITGSKSFDEWNEYLNELKKIGKDKLLEVLVTAYQRSTKTR